MFTKEEKREFIVKLGRRWLFPDFYNKLTWYVVTLGAGVILTPVPIKLIFCNWIIDLININSGKFLTLPELGSSNADYVLGFALIFSALAHNIFSKFILSKSEDKNRIDAEKVNVVDRELFKDFLKVFPSGSLSIKLLENHDFGNSFSLECLRDMDKFVEEWNCPEKCFINSELEKIRKELWDKCYEFSWLIARKSAPISGGRQSVVPDSVKNDWDWPKWVDNDVKEVNKMASEVFYLHQNFIKRMRECLFI